MRKQQQRTRTPTNMPLADLRAAVRRARLDRQDWKRLAGHLRVKVDSPDYRAMRRQVRRVLANYQLRYASAKDKISPAAAIGMLEPIWRHAKALDEGLRKLPLALRVEFDSEPVSAGDAVARLVRAVDAAIQRYRRREKVGRPARDKNEVQGALRDVVSGLQAIFERFHRVPPGKKESKEQGRRKERDFVIAALKAAHVPHPDPNTNRYRFNKLLIRRSSKSLGEAFHPDYKPKNPERLADLQRRLASLDI